MAVKWVAIKIITWLLFYVVQSAHRHRSFDTWVVQVKGGKEIVQLLAEQHHFQYVGEVAGFDDHYKLATKTFSYNNSAGHNNKQLEEHPMVVWAERQYGRRRVKRDESRVSIKEEKARQYERLREERKRDHKEALNRQKRGIFSWFWSRYSYFFNDALWSKQWYLQDYRTDGGVPVLDLNVVPCYARGITGKGIRISILDDGLEWTHPDLRENYEPYISADLVEGDRDPMPRYGNDSNNSHGTRCAGEIAMKANNNICGVGISFNAKVGGVKILDGPTTDVMEGSALIFAIDKVDIYSNSWGPPDDGKTVEAPGKIARNALHTGILKGRNGKGAIYVFAAGNGKMNGDNCACDGYINSIYTVPIASATQRGQPPFYGERCAAIFATAYSSGNRADEKIATTDLNGECTTKHSGTSAAAPLAAGIFALTLQANPNLTWRCVQHIVIWTSEVAVLGEDDEWQQNKAGFWINPNFGFGLLNAYNMIKLATNFKTVPEKTKCNVFLDESYYNTTFDTESTATLKLQTNGCANTENEINFLEHVQVVMNISYSYRGAIEIFLTSPSGMKTTLMEARPDDDSKKGFKDWWITTVHNWGERPEGNWTVHVTANGPPDYPDYYDGVVEYVHIVLHGTKDMPHHYKAGRRQYSTYDFNMEPF